MRNQFAHGLASIKGSVLEIMARNMAAADVQFLATKWGLSKTPSITAAPAPAPVAAPAPVPNPPTTTPAATTAGTEAAKTAVVEAQKSFTNSATGIKYLYHPLLGELICDLSYKKVYLTSVRALAAAPVWQKQRTLRLNRAEMIVKAKKKNLTGSILPGVISMYHDQRSDEVGIFDGQHRTAALVLLAKEGLWDERTRNVTVDVFEINTEIEIKTLFSEINAAEPVKLIDMPVLEEELPPSKTEVMVILVVVVVVVVV
jgi:hypothetical protein